VVFTDAEVCLGSLNSMSVLLTFLFFSASNVIVLIVHRNRDIAHLPKGTEGNKQLPYKPSVSIVFVYSLGCYR